MGLTTKEVTTEYSLDEETKKLKVVKQKVQEKSIPPNIDIIKLIYQHMVDTTKDYNKFTDEELEKEKQRLLLELGREEIASREKQNQDKV